MNWVLLLLSTCSSRWDFFSSLCNCVESHNQQEELLSKPSFHRLELHEQCKPASKRQILRAFKKTCLTLHERTRGFLLLKLNKWPWQQPNDAWAHLVLQCTKHPSVLPQHCHHENCYWSGLNDQFNGNISVYRISLYNPALVYAFVPFRVWTTRRVCQQGAQCCTAWTTLPPSWRLFPWTLLATCGPPSATSSRPSSPSYPPCFLWK